ncbi:hypothetical protein RJ639_024495 [Escallonia herrerae]|uniref:Pentatricopeptide repeat-containing protein n=1 Tax=Escallonia herrerae TaxID=1293975 RepID=A0AA89ADX7_9ASTE|nr:hypothetical protein RJ639_024495 [Escallonia herrerae]
MLLQTTIRTKGASLSQIIQLSTVINLKTALHSSSAYQTQSHSPASTTYTAHPTNQLPFDYASFLNSCIARRAIEAGRQLHAHLCIKGLGSDTKLATKLVHLYCSCNYLSNAHLLFDRIHKSNIFLWNVLIRGYAWNGPFDVAISLYYRMSRSAAQPFDPQVLLAGSLNLGKQDAEMNIVGIQI